jgi:hypothetical protein
MIARLGLLVLLMPEAAVGLELLAYVLIARP